MAKNLNTTAVIQDKIQSTATDILNKVKNAGKREPTFSEPVRYSVVNSRGTVVRKGFEQASEAIRRLSLDDVVTVVELSGRRARIISPVEGWVTVESRQGTVLLQRSMVQRGAHQVEALESLFEQRRKQQMKGSQGLSGKEKDCRSVKHDRKKERVIDPDTCSDSDSDRDDERRRRGAGVSRHTVGAASSAVVPKLAAPGSAAGPVVLAPPPTSSLTGSISSCANKDQGLLDLIGMDASPHAAVGASNDASFDPSAPRPPSSSMASGTDDWADFDSFNPSLPVQPAAQQQCAFDVFGSSGTAPTAHLPTLQTAAHCLPTNFPGLPGPAGIPAYTGTGVHQTMHQTADVPAFGAGMNKNCWPGGSAVPLQQHNWAFTFGGA